ncbi:hypothetical protein GCM10023115_05830 [Pontixanthobacter gangjinensis]|uniref:Mlr4739 protein n=1 Tax=Pontixanthobacter gangjinensis TaxID=1028742 RepID=A0A6I4SM44_9SPHN|nr:hypothetical protein [Pontixanthobacter gangjinensis]MXO55832.1 hypothetical protein [Pontixanthobacter gangjinensis]
MTTDRRNRGHERPNTRIAIMWLVVSAIFLAAGWQRLQQGQFPDPDDAMRLVQVRDLLAGQSWFDLHQYRLGSSDGVLMHWSRLVDIPIALVVLILSPIIGVAAAESSAMVAVPLMTLGAILFVLGRLAWRLFDADIAGYACLCIGLLAPVVFQLQPMRLDHHGWQIFTIVLALWAISIRSPLKGGAIAGIAMAVGASISVEILPMAAAFGALLVLRWLRNRDERWWLVSYMQALALSLCVVFLATRGITDLANHCDAIAPAHLGFFIIAAIGTGVIAAAPKVPPIALIGLLGLTGMAALSFFGLSAPTCLAAPFAELDPAVRNFWYLNISEGRPLWEQDLWTALPSFLQLLISLGAALMLFVGSRDWLRQWWGEYAMLLLASIILSVFVWRSAAFAGALSAIPLAWLAARLLAAIRHTSGAASKAVGAIAIILILLPATPITLYRSFAAKPEIPPTSAVADSRCDIQDHAEKLANLETGRILAPLDIGPSILLKSGHSVLATSHHRAEMAMRDVIVAYTSVPAEARPILRDRDIDYVVMCTDLVEPKLYADANPDGLAAKLLAGESPEWLEPVVMDGPKEFQVWRIR